MTEEKIIKQLKSLNRLGPRDAWRKEDRRAMLEYVDLGNTENILKRLSLMELSRFWLRNLAQPAVTVFLIIIIVFGGSAMSLRAARDTKPGDSLYIAKIIYEKTQITLAFSEKKKAELGLEFAGNRAQELSQVLKETQTEAKNEKVEKLVSNFKKEISIAKDRIAKFNIEGRLIDPSKELPLTTEEIVEPEDKDNQVFSATLGKEEQGVQLSDSGGSTESAVIEEEASEEESIVEEIAVDASSTEEILQATSSEAVEEEAVEESSDPEQLINEAQLLLESRDYDATLDKLTEARESIDQVTIGEVKRGSEAATTSEAVIDNEVEPSDEAGEVLGVSDEASSTDSDIIR